MCEQKFGFLIEKPLLIFAFHIGKKLINIYMCTLLSPNMFHSLLSCLLLQVLVTSLSLQQVDYQEPANFWIGPRAVSVHNCWCRKQLVNLLQNWSLSHCFRCCLTHCSYIVNKLGASSLLVAFDGMSQLAVK